MKTILVFVLFFLTLPGAYAQHAHFPASGTIEFEKSVNVYALIKAGQITGKSVVPGNEQQLFEQYRLSKPQFSVSRSMLVFKDSKTLFTPVDRGEASGTGFSVPFSAQNNTVYADYTGNRLIAAKIVMGADLLLTDSTRKINWKLTNETREVAGYLCRRANAIVMDSIYVVAFFTEKIHVPGGPESFGGLPGMILELVLPHEHVSWRAKAVTEQSVDPIKPPVLGKPVDRTKLMALLEELAKNGKPGQAAMIRKINSL